MQARFTLGKDVQDKIEKLITAVEEELDDDAESIITDARGIGMREYMENAMTKLPIRFNLRSP